jgi:hypothetical protein
MGKVKCKQLFVTKDNWHENSAFGFTDENGKIIAKINVFPNGNVYVWEAKDISVPATSRVTTKDGLKLQ